MTRPITQHQFVVYSWIRWFQQKELYSPALREIAAEFGVAVNAVAKTVNSLVAKDYLQLSPTGHIKFPHGTALPKAGEEYPPRHPQTQAHCRSMAGGARPAETRTATAGRKLAVLLLPNSDLERQ